MSASRAPDRPPPNRHRLDPDLVNDSILDVCAFYAGGPGKSMGRRTTWYCPECAKPKLEALPERRLAGCWNESCSVPTTTDALGLVAFFENLDRRTEFPELLRRAYAAVGLEADASTRPGTPNRGPRKGAARTTAPSEPVPEQAPAPDPELLDRVYATLLTLCPLTRRGARFWAGRGVGEETVLAGRFASATPSGVRAACHRLREIVGVEALLGVPGFFENARGEISCTLVGDYALIPYHDRAGRLRTIEGRAMTPEQEKRTAKYVALRDSGSHLYLFPGFPFDRIEAFTEGPIGAIVAAQEGLAVASIKGIRCYRAPDGGPLPELEGADFAGRVVPYIPDADDPPKADVLEEAPKAARALTLPHNGRPALAALPRGLDLDEWLLSLPKNSEHRRGLFRGLLAGARPVPERGVEDEQ